VKSTNHAAPHYAVKLSSTTNKNPEVQIKVFTRWRAGRKNRAEVNMLLIVWISVNVFFLSNSLTNMTARIAGYETLHTTDNMASQTVPEQTQLQLTQHCS
jgi:hypothetical protein